MLQYLFRFLMGGMIVSLFASLGGVLKPKSFAGLFGAAPSVALATLGLTVLADGKAYAALEARSMVVGAGCFLVYSAVCTWTWLMLRKKVEAAQATIGSLVVWLAGGAITVTAGILAKHYGPVYGGLFLAFPAIFPASATLVAKHETQKKQNAGIATSSRGRQAAAVDAAGAALGSVGLAAFALTVWKLLPLHNSSFVFLAATSVWLVLAILSWRIWKKQLCR